MKENKYVSLAAKIIIGLFLFFAGFYLGTVSEPNTFSSYDDGSDKNQTQFATLIIDLGDDNREIFYDVEFTAESSLFEFLLSLSESRNMEFSYQDYGPDLGVFIKSIDNVGNDNSGAWWQYWVNDEYGQIGVSQYIVKSGDIIEFRYTD